MKNEKILLMLLMEDPSIMAARMKSGDSFQSTQELLNFIKKLPYCPAPWLHSHINPLGERKLCCNAKPSDMNHEILFQNYWNSDYLQKIRERMIDHNPPEECERCILHKGNDSPRSRYLKLVIRLIHLHNFIWKTTTDMQPVSVDYRIEGHCNFACRMCSAVASDTIQKREDAARITSPSKRIPKRAFEAITHELFEILKTQNIAEIRFADGEPFISQLHWEIINYLISNNSAHNIALEYISNISTLRYKKISIPQFIKKHFSEIFVAISIDGVGKTAEFVRDGLVWETWYKNYKQLRETLGKGSVLLSITVSIPVLLDIVSLSRFLKEEDVYFSISSVLPEGNELLISPQSLDNESLKNIITPRLTLIENDQIKKYLERLVSESNTTHNQKLIKEFESIAAYYSKLDLAAKRDSTVEFLSTHPELKTWWEGLQVL